MVVKEWAEEQGLLGSQDCSASVQVVALAKRDKAFGPWLFLCVHLHCWHASAALLLRYFHVFPVLSISLYFNFVFYPCKHGSSPRATRSQFRGPTLLRKPHAFCCSADDVQMLALKLGLQCIAVLWRGFVSWPPLTMADASTQVVI